MLIPDWLGRRAIGRPASPALIVGSQSWSYAELDARATTLAQRLAALGVRQGDRVGTLLRNGPHVAVAVHALIRLGAILVPLNLRLAEFEIAWQIRRAGVGLLLHDEDTARIAGIEVPWHFLPRLDQEEVSAASDLAHLQEPSSVDEVGDQAPSGVGKPGRVDPPGLAAASGYGDGRSPVTGLRTRIDLDLPHCLIYTSGTTGRPKGVLLSYGNHWWGATGSVLTLGLREDDRWLACLPLFHIGGLSILLRAAIYGIPVVFPDPPGGHFDPVLVARAIEDQRATIVSLVGAQLTRLLEVPERGWEAALRCVLLGGGPAPRPLLEACASRGIAVAQSYGLTEACSQVATLAPRDALRKLGSAGQPLLPTEIRIARMAQPADGGSDAHGGAPTPAAGTTSGTDEPGAITSPDPITGDDASPASLRDHTPGEILVRGPTISPGYLPPEGEGMATHAVTDTEGWLHTGDIGYLDAEGYLYVLDRRTDLIISGGENIYPAEVEAVLLAHPAVSEAGVYGIPDPVWGRRAAGAVVPRPGIVLDKAELLAFCRARLAKYKVPARIEVRESLPRNASGKLLRRLL